jgi:ubiquinone biosynthesis protein COQ9
MPQRRRTDQHKLIAEAALKLADERGWDRFSLADTAKKARLKEADVARTFPDTWAILIHVLHDLDAQTLRAADTDKKAPWRDNLFEILMARFDLMDEHRAAFVSVLPALLKNPQAAPHFVRPFYRSMRELLEHASAPATPPHVAAFGAAYLAIIDAWRRDETADLSRTMAAADKYLGMFEKYGACLAMPRPASRRK